MKKTTEQLKQHLKELVANYNKAVDTQKEYKEKIIAVHAVIQDRELDGNSNTVTSKITED